MEIARYDIATDATGVLLTDTKHYVEVTRDDEGFVAGLSVKHQDDDSLCAVGDVLGPVGVINDDVLGEVIGLMIVTDAGAGVVGVIESSKRIVI